LVINSSFAVISAGRLLFDVCSDADQPACAPGNIAAK
jgi:hypothetical protein